MTRWKLIIGMEDSIHTYDIVSDSVAQGAFEDALDWFYSRGFRLSEGMPREEFRRYLVHPELGVGGLVALEKVGE